MNRCRKVNIAVRSSAIVNTSIRFLFELERSLLHPHGYYLTVRQPQLDVAGLYQTRRGVRTSSWAVLSADRNRSPRYEWATRAAR